MIDTPTWFGPADRALFGWFCTPDSGCSDYGVLLCPPIGEEEHNAHETIRRTAWGLAGRGVASLRFDYHGTGDSMGNWSDADQVDAWLTSIKDAYDALLATGVPRIGGLGMRVGATLLATAAAREAVDLNILALWDPCSGKSMLREGLARSPSTTEQHDGSVETPGYVYAPQTVTDLQRIDPAALPGDVAVGTILILNRDDRPAPRGLHRAFPPSDTVEWETCAGMSDMLDVPMDQNAVPDAAVEQVVAWIDRHVDRQDPAPLKVRSLAVDLPRPRGGAILESAVRLGDVGLFGICTEPAERTRGVTVVFVNVANDRQTGPGRRWVEMARDLAADGFRCIRLSQSGTGDSPTRPGQTFGELYCPQWLTDLPDALSDATFGDDRIALVSLCSGAYSALEAAMRVHVAAVYPINVILTIRDTSRGQRLHSDARQVARPVGRAFLPRTRSSARRMGIAWRVYRQVAVWHAPLSAVHGLIRRGTAVVLVMSPGDGRHFWESAYWTGLFSWRWRRTGMFRLPIDEHIDHPLMTQAGQAAAVAAIETDLHRRFPAVARSADDEGASVPTTRGDTNSRAWTHEAAGYSQHFDWNDAGERVSIHRVADTVRGQRVLDVGVGTGRTTWLVGLLTQHYVGIDYTQEMVDLALHSCPGADIRLGDARALEFADASIDFVFFSNAGIDSLSHEDRGRALSEFARVLRPGGLLVYSTLNRLGPFYHCGPGPVSRPDERSPGLYSIARFGARAARSPREHLDGFRNVRANRPRFEDHGAWAIATMPTHSWSLVVHYVTANAAAAEVSSHGFNGTTMIDRYGKAVEHGDTATDSAWFYVITHRNEL